LEIMNVIRAATTQVLTVRSMEVGDLPRLLQIEKQTPAPRWTLRQFKTDLRCADRINLVATVKNYVVGFVIAKLLSPPEPKVPGKAEPAAQSGGETPPLLAPVHLSILHLAVASDWLRRGIGHSLLKKLDPFLRQPGDRIEAAVPETNLPAQLLLRSAGYRATRVLRGFYGTQDAYLMERRRD
jgi:ribosomal protein S18 acetylase RimI-like enzyme